MKEIKKYSIYLSEEGNICDDNLDYSEYEDEKWCRSKDVDQIITKHKSVVETMQKRIDELEADRLGISEAIYICHTKIAEYPNGRQYHQCRHCYEEIIKDIGHDKNCIVLKAERIIKESK